MKDSLHRSWVAHQAQIDNDARINDANSVFTQTIDRNLPVPFLDLPPQYNDIEGLIQSNSAANGSSGSMGSRPGTLSRPRPVSWAAGTADTTHSHHQHWQNNSANTYVPPTLQTSHSLPYEPGNSYVANQNFNSWSSQGSGPTTPQASLSTLTTSVSSSRLSNSAPTSATWSGNSSSVNWDESSQSWIQILGAVAAPPAPSDASTTYMHRDQVHRPEAAASPPVLSIVSPTYTHRDQNEPVSPVSPISPPRSPMARQLRWASNSETHLPHVQNDAPGVRVTSSAPVSPENTWHRTGNYQQPSNQHHHENAGLQGPPSNRNVEQLSTALSYGQPQHSVHSQQQSQGNVAQERLAGPIASYGLPSPQIQVSVRPTSPGVVTISTARVPSSAIALPLSVSTSNVHIPASDPATSRFYHPPAPNFRPYTYHAPSSTSTPATPVGNYVPAVSGPQLQIPHMRPRAHSAVPSCRLSTASAPPYVHRYHSAASSPLMPPVQYPTQGHYASNNYPSYASGEGMWRQTGVTADELFMGNGVNERGRSREREWGGGGGVRGAYADGVPVWAI